MRATDARRLAPIVVVLVAVAGLLGTGRDAEHPAAAVPEATTALWATVAGIEAVLPAKLETGLERAGLTTSSKQRSELAVLVLPLLLACAVARRASAPADVPGSTALCSLTAPERGPPLPLLSLA